MDDAGIDPHAIIYRVKSRTSAEYKIDKYRDKYGSFSELHDMLGIRVITHLGSEVRSVVKALEENFSIDDDRSKNKADILDAEKFGYLSVHLIAAVDDGRKKFPEWARFSNVEFEIQVRTVLQHAWAEIEHDLGYKSPHGTISKGYRRRFARLASLLEIADEEFDKLAKELLAREEKITSDLRKMNKTSIDAKSVRKFALTNETIRSIESRVAEDLSLELSPAENVGYYNVRATELQSVGFVSLEQIIDYARPIQDQIASFISSWFKAGPEFLEYDGISRGISLFYIYLIKDVELLGDDFNSAPGVSSEDSNEKFIALYKKIFIEE